MTLELPDRIRETIVDHARAGVPSEVVGVLAGSRGDRSSVERAYAARNAAETPRTRYEIDPEAELAFLERIDDHGFDVVGFYHSHPNGPAEPSDVDARQAAWPGYSYLIVSLAGEDATLGSWRWNGDRFDSERIRTV
jgi:proteasome lid subunit RPN8/RPN11